MSRKTDRIKKKMELNPIKELNKIQTRFYPDLFGMFKKVRDPRHKSYTSYSTKTMLSQIYYKNIVGIESMQDMTKKFNDEKVAKTIYQFTGEDIKEYLPHGVTENEFLERLDSEELEKIIQVMIYKAIRRKTFDEARVFKKWLILIDATELDEGNTKKNDKYLSRTYHRGEENEFIKYHRAILEAKIYFGNDLVASIASEAIENSEEYINKKDSEVKQDCESKAFKRLAKKLKERFPRLPIIIVADSLYVSSSVIEICKANGWDYIIRYKEGSASSIEEEYNLLPEKKRVGNDIEYQNDIVFGNNYVNLIKYTDKKGDEKATHFEWITSIEITKNNAKRIVRAGRNRWKIENQGFNRQKNWQGNINHACSWNATAQKNHYLMEQIADFIKQLYEWFFLKKNEIKKSQKNISFDLLITLVQSKDIENKLQTAIST